MKNSPDQTAESFYFDVFGIISSHGDFFQPKNDVDFFLSEAILTSITTTVLAAILKGMLEEFGKKLIGKLRFDFFRKKKLIDAKPEILISELATIFESGKFDLYGTEKIRNDIKAELKKFEIAEAVSDKIASEIIIALERNRNALK